MKSIEIIVEQIREELEDAQAYTEAASEATGDAGLTALYSTLAYEELDHATRLHGKAITLIGSARASGAEPTEEMRKTWATEHTAFVEVADNIRKMLSNLA